MVTGCMADAPFSYWRTLIVCLFLQEFAKVKESILYHRKCSYYVFTLLGRIVKNERSRPTLMTSFINLPCSTSWTVLPIYLAVIPLLWFKELMRCEVICWLHTHVPTLGILYVPCQWGGTETMWHEKYDFIKSLYNGVVQNKLICLWLL